MDQNELLKLIQQYQAGGHTPGYNQIAGYADQIANTLFNPESGQNAMSWLDSAASAIEPYLRPAASAMVPQGIQDNFGDLGGQAYDKLKYYSRNPYEAASDATQAVWDLGPGQALQGSRQMTEAATGDGTPAQRFAKALEGGMNVIGGGGGIPGMDDLIMKGAPMAMLMGRNSNLWNKLAAQGPYGAEDIPLGAFSSRYFGKEAGPQVEVFNPTSLAPHIEDLQAKRGKIMEMISPTDDMRQYEGRMRNLVQDPVGYQAYPQEAYNPATLTLDRRVSDPSGATYPPAFDPGSPSGMSNRMEGTAPNRESLLKTAIHEKSHPRGRSEWGAGGGDPFGSGSMETYLSRPGEIYARTEANTANILPEQRAADINRGQWPNSGVMYVGDKPMPALPFWEYADMPPELSGLSMTDLSQMQQAVAKGRATPEQNQMNEIFRMLMR